jgi:hypothetical protein
VPQATRSDGHANSAEDFQADAVRRYGGAYVLEIKSVALAEGEH